MTTKEGDLLLKLLRWRWNGGRFNSYHLL